MVLQDWGVVIISSLQEVWASVITFIPLLVGAVIVFLIGWVIAVATGKLVEQVIRASRVDQFLAKLDFEQAMERAGVKLNSGAFIGGLVRWFLIIAFLLASVNILGERFQPISDFLRQVLAYLPNVIVAAVILVIAALIADVAEKLVRGSVESLGFKVSLAGILTRWSIWTFGIITALAQLGVAQLLSNILQIIITGIVLMFALAFGISFGLGGRDAAAEFIAKTRREMAEK